MCTNITFFVYICVVIVKKLYDLPKISLNQFYSGQHWSKRSRLKNDYRILIRSQLGKDFKPFSKDGQYDAEYDFFFKSRPLDADNCVAMVKLITDTIFEDDHHNIIKSIKITSNKSYRDCVVIKIDQLNAQN